MYSIQQRTGERGSAMLISLLVLLSLTMIGGLFFAQTKTEVQISGHDMRHTQALYNAEAGTAEVLARMANMRDSTNYIGEGFVFDPGWGRYVVLQSGASAADPDYDATLTDGLDNDGDAMVDEQGEHYPEILTMQNGSQVSYPWTRVNYRLTGANQVVLFGDHDGDATTPPVTNLTRGTPVILVTSNGTQGTSARTVEVEAVRQPFPTLDTATYSEDDAFAFNGTQFLVSGQDWDPDTRTVIPGNPEVPGILTTGDPTTITGSLSAQQQNNVEGSGSEPSVTQSTINLDLQALRDEYVPLAEYTIPTGTYDAMYWGNSTDYTVVHCTGDMHTSGSSSGGGLLIIDGDFDCSGSFTWYGLVLVLGEIRFTGGGAGIHIYGTVLTQGGLGGQSVSGNADIMYSSVALQRLAGFTPYQVSRWQEL